MSTPTLDDLAALATCETCSGVGRVRQEGDEQNQKLPTIVCPGCNGTAVPGHTATDWECFAVLASIALTQAAEIAALDVRVTALERPE